MIVDGVIDEEALEATFRDNAGILADEWVLFPYLYAIPDLFERTEVGHAAGGGVVTTTDGVAKSTKAPAAKKRKSGVLRIEDDTNNYINNLGVEVAFPGPRSRGGQSQEKRAKWEAWTRAREEALAREAAGQPVPAPPVPGATAATPAGAAAAAGSGGAPATPAKKVSFPPVPKDLGRLAEGTSKVISSSIICP